MYRLSAAPSDHRLLPCSSHQASWSSLRTDHSTLTPAQLHHLLSHYQLGPGRGPPPAWDPPPAEQDAVDTGEEKWGYKHWAFSFLLSLGPRSPCPQPSSDPGCWTHSPFSPA